MDEDKKTSVFHRPKLVKTVRIEGRNTFVPTSYYFALYDDNSYSLYDGETFKYMSGNKKFNFGSMIRGTKEVCQFQKPDALGKYYRLFYDAVNDYDQREREYADYIAKELGIDQHRLSSMYYYDPENPRDDYVWENYKNMRKLFIDKCEKLGISYEEDSSKIISGAISTLENHVDERFKDYKNDLSYCTSVESVIKKYNEEVAEANTEFELSKISSKFSFAKQDAIDYPSSFFELTDRAIIALKSGKKSDRDLLRQYTEFLIALPSYCQILSQMEKCASDAKKKKQRLKLERFYDNPEFIADLNDMIEHDTEQETYYYHVTQGEVEAEKIMQKGLYMFSDRMDSTTFPELSTNEILQYGYGNDFASFDDYIIVIAQPKDKQIVRRLSEYEREQAQIVPRRAALMSKPTDIIDSEYIVGYIDKQNCQVVRNKNFVHINKENT